MAKPLNYRPVCDDRGNFLPWLSDVSKASGAYVIRNRISREVLYVGESHTGQLRKTIVRHFWPHKETIKRHDLYQRGRVEVAVRVCPPGPAAIGCQNNLIQRLQPRDNRQGFEPDPF